MQEKQTKQPRAYLLLRALCAFAVCLLVGVGIHFFSLHHHANVAEWSEAGSREALVYENTTYYLKGELGDKGLPENTYQTEELKGEVKPAKLLDPSQPLLVWTVKGTEKSIVVVDGDHRYVYGLEEATNTPN